MPRILLPSEPLTLSRRPALQTSSRFLHLAHCEVVVVVVRRHLTHMPDYGGHIGIQVRAFPREEDADHESVASLSSFNRPMRFWIIPSKRESTLA
jgi:hypothetical protein